MLAIRGRSLNAFRLLLEWGADVYAQDTKGMTALMKAVRKIPDARSTTVESYIVKHLLEYAVASREENGQFFCCLKKDEDGIYLIAYNSSPIRTALTKHLGVVSLFKLLNARTIDRANCIIYAEKRHNVALYLS